MVRRVLQRRLPTEEKLRQHPSLRWLGPLLRRPWLWQLSRRRVAAGAAIGVFFGMLIPVLQIAFAVAVAVLLRANVPVAAVATLVSNPITYVPIFTLAYRTGAALMGSQVDAQRAEAVAVQLDPETIDDAGPLRWGRRLLAIGRPLLLGLAVFAVCGAALTWVAVNLLWTVAVNLRWRKRRRASGQTDP